MVALRSDIEKALDELISNEEGMRFQGLAVTLAKLRWPELIASERKNDLGLDAYASAQVAPDGKGKGLACSITPTISKIRDDAAKASENFDDLEFLIFATPLKVSNPNKRDWANKIAEEFGFRLEVMSREEIITSLMIPSNTALCRGHLGIESRTDETMTDLVDRVKQAVEQETSNWSNKFEGEPLINLATVKLDEAGRDSREVFRLSQIRSAVAQSRRIILDAPAGRDKTTTNTSMGSLLRELQGMQQPWEFQ